MCGSRGRIRRESEPDRALMRRRAPGTTWASLRLLPWQPPSCQETVDVTSRVARNDRVPRRDGRPPPPTCCHPFPLLEDHPQNAQATRPGPHNSLWRPYSRYLGCQYLSSQYQETVGGKKRREKKKNKKTKNKVNTGR